MTLPDDHAERMSRARLALDGLSVGDALGAQFFIPINAKRIFDPSRPVPPPVWGYTDDTEMGIAIAEVLSRHGRVEQSDLALTFARRYDREMYRGYGPMAHRILAAILSGRPWAEVSRQVFDGQGSMGNGSAMRVGPVGGYFAEDLPRVAREAALSAEVTHAHPEGIAGAVAAAVAGAFAWQARGRAGDARLWDDFFDSVLTFTAAGATRRGIEEARQLGPGESLSTAAQALGNGSGVTTPDTVPFCLWVAARHLHDYPAAIWTTIGADGDVDTTCAIVGGIVALATGAEGIPADWLAAREPLDQFD